MLRICFLQMWIYKGEGLVGDLAPSSSTAVLALLHFPPWCCSLSKTSTERSGLQQVACACTGIAIP